LRRFLELEREGTDRARGAAQQLDAALRNVESAMAAAAFDQPALAMARDVARRALASRRALSPSRLNAEVDRVERELRGSWRRLQDLERCALDEAGVAHVVAVAAQAGLQLGERAPLVHAGQNIIGWRLTLRKAG
jgi:hypothetical protein